MPPRSAASAGGTRVGLVAATAQVALELAELVGKVVGFDGDLMFDTTKPDGTPRKLMDVTRLNSIGWQASTGLAEGLSRAYRDFQAGLSAP